ncbi:MAG: transporter substrate-binding protein [Caldilineaceae bacterium]|nr:transporter substrate-binding protein [Caldilineaceae bacterium]
MISLLGPLLALLILFGVTYLLVEQWDQVKWQVIARLILALILFGVVAYGVRYWLVIGASCLPDCVGANLVGREMSGARLNGANLVSANLSRTDLSKASLRGADLSGALLVRVNLEGADLRDAQLLGANLERANLAGANLAGARFDGADLIEADLTGVDLTETSLLGVNLEGAEMESVDLTGVMLAAVDLVDAKLNGARLVNVDLTGATLSRADLSGAQMSGSNLSGAWLNLATLIGADLSNADLSGASLMGANLASANFGSSRMVGATLVGADMNGSNLNGVNLLGARLLLDELTDADLTLDRAVEELNELQRSLILVDAEWEGATFDTQTVWPNLTVNEEMAATIELIDSSEAIPTDTIKVGVLHSLSGPLAISEVAARDAAFLAIDEINAAGGVLGKQLEPIVEDGASSPEVFAEKARKLLETNGVAVVFGGWRTDSRNAMIPIFEELNGLLFYPAPAEGFQQSPNIVYMGQDPSQQIIPAVNYLAEQGYVNLLLIGSEISYSQVVHAIIQVQARELGQTVVGELLVPLGESDFGSLMEQLRASPPDLIINTMNGESNIGFFQQLTEAGFTASDIPIISTGVAEEEVRIIGPEFMVGHMTTGNYFQTVQSPENFSFVTAYKSIYGQERVTSASIVAAYTGVHLWHELVEKAQSIDVEQVRAAMAQPIDYIGPAGPVQIDVETQYTFQWARIGTVREDGLIEEAIRSEEPLPPDPFLTAYPWVDEVQQMVESLSETTEQ